MARTPVARADLTYPTGEQWALAVPLDFAGDWLGIPNCAFNGVANPDEWRGACTKLWRQSERERLARAMMQSERRIEERLEYHLRPRWIAGERHKLKRGSVGQAYRWGATLNRGLLLDPGALRRTAVTPTGEDVSGDPFEFEFATADLAGGELVAFETASGLRIHIPLLEEAGATTTAYIPKCQLATMAAIEAAEAASAGGNTFAGVDYTVAANFLEMGDITWELWDTDPSTQGVLVWFPPHCQCVGPACDPVTQDGCVLAIDDRTAVVTVQPSVWDETDEEWDRATPTCCDRDPDQIRVYYRSGRELATPEDQEAVLNLTMARSGLPFCSCDGCTPQWHYMRDPAVYRHTDGHVVLNTPEMTRCPWGPNLGAWLAWNHFVDQGLVRSASR